MEDRINEPIEDDEEFLCEGISNEEYMRRFLEKYELYNEGKLTEDDFHGFEIFLLVDLLKERALALCEKLDEMVRQRNIEYSRRDRHTT